MAASCFVIGILLCCYPFFSSRKEEKRQLAAIRTYEKSVVEKREMEEVWQEAKNYNEALQKYSGKIVKQEIEQILEGMSYEEILNLSKTGMMGSLEIPTIKVHLPIYHGTAEGALAVGAGHVEGTALPVGGENSRCVLAGHRGLPNSELFTRLDEIETGDRFFLNVCGKTLAYQVEKIEVIKPENTEILDAEPGRDLVSLITCTPYGLNTHRLVVTGERVPYQKDEQNKIEEKFPSIRELCFVMLPIVFFILGARGMARKSRRRKKN